MPPAKKPTPSAPRTRAAFKEPVALTRLNRSLDAAQEALAELRKDTGRDVGQGARDLYRDLRTFVTSARRDSGKAATSGLRPLLPRTKRATTARPTASFSPARKR
jgi:hypothetical protein